LRSNRKRLHTNCIPRHRPRLPIDVLNAVVLPGPLKTSSAPRQLSSPSFVITHPLIVVAASELETAPQRQLIVQYSASLSRKMSDTNFPNGDGNGLAAPPFPVVLSPFLLPGPLVAPLPRWYQLTINETSSIGREAIGIADVIVVDCDEDVVGAAPGAIANVLPYD
jgi:hypothetical protein